MSGDRIRVLVVVKKRALLTNGTQGSVRTAYGKIYASRRCECCVCSGLPVWWDSPSGILPRARQPIRIQREGKRDDVSSSRGHGTRAWVPFPHRTPMREARPRFLVLRLKKNNITYTGKKYLYIFICIYQ